LLGRSLSLSDETRRGRLLLLFVAPDAEEAKEATFKATGEDGAGWVRFEISLSMTVDGGMRCWRLGGRGKTGRAKEKRDERATTRRRRQTRKKVGLHFLSLSDWTSDEKERRSTQYNTKRREKRGNRNYRDEKEKGNYDFLLLEEKKKTTTMRGEM
jgi:hypothetical protein